jgi:hypothetical protein
VGVGKPSQRVEEAGHEQRGASLLTGGQCPAGSGPKPAGAGDMCCARAASGTEGEGRG